mmetsp:Transcript_46189/g.116304  ORF Transcript_46189/g.116304 Transcript_46189/m.116304 type:complete len:205 (-) Transcript_46189:358-972(-)
MSLRQSSSPFFWSSSLFSSSVLAAMGIAVPGGQTAWSATSSCSTSHSVCGLAPAGLADCSCAFKADAATLSVHASYPPLPRPSTGSDAANSSSLESSLWYFPASPPRNARLLVGSFFFISALKCRTSNCTNSKGDTCAFGCSKVNPGQVSRSVAGHTALTSSPCATSHLSASILFSSTACARRRRWSVLSAWSVFGPSSAGSAL